MQPAQKIFHPIGRCHGRQSERDRQKNSGDDFGELHWWINSLKEKQRTETLTRPFLQASPYRARASRGRIRVSGLHTSKNLRFPAELRGAESMRKLWMASTRANHRSRNKPQA